MVAPATFQPSLAAAVDLTMVMSLTTEILTTMILPIEERRLTAVAHPTTMTPPIRVALRPSVVSHPIKADRDTMALILERVAQLKTTSEEEVVLYYP